VGHWPTPGPASASIRPVEGDKCRQPENTLAELVSINPPTVRAAVRVAPRSQRWLARPATDRPLAGTYLYEAGTDVEHRS
jgi:hypothetical protein